MQDNAQLTQEENEWCEEAVKLIVKYYGKCLKELEKT